MSNIRLNILPVSQSEFSFSVYRKRTEAKGKEKEEGIFYYHLPNNNSENRDLYLVSLSPKEGYDAFVATSSHAVGLTKHYLFQKLHEFVESSDQFEHRLPNRKFRDDILEFITEKTPQGDQVISLSPYYHAESQRYGFLVDFKFNRAKDYAFDKEVQKLSLSLDKFGRSNKNYYSDKFRLITNFLNTFFRGSDNLHLEEGLHLQNSLLETPVFQLSKKEYIFNNKNTSHSQFQGIRNFGPFKKIDEDVIFVFIFEDRYRSFANEIYLSLIGKSNPGTFPGFKAMFDVELSVDNTDKIIIEEYTEEHLRSIVKKVKDINSRQPTKKVIGIYLENYSDDKEDTTGSTIYYYLKYHFIKNGLPLQVINYSRLGDKSSLKWSTSNLALAMFAKIGGIPWIVKPSNNNCLILGIGSSHKKHPETGEIIKYFAYTVCLDSSGLYKTLEVLADDTSESHYLEKLQKNLINLLKDTKLQGYKTCVLHIPFKIKHHEISAISDAINSINHIEFVAIKVNVKNKYFGYSYHNTLVPYESSFVKLSDKEYLVWFEGLQYGKEIVDKRLSNPVHIQFLSLKNQHIPDEKRYLQDVLNLSGANWRGFNAKSIPISIYYSQIIARYTEEFEKISDFQENSITNDKPWFL